MFLRKFYNAFQNKNLYILTVLGLGEEVGGVYNRIRTRRGYLIFGIRYFLIYISIFIWYLLDTLWLLVNIYFTCFVKFQDRIFRCSWFTDPIQEQETSLPKNWKIMVKSLLKRNIHKTWSFNHIFLIIYPGTIIDTQNWLMTLWRNYNVIMT